MQYPLRLLFGLTVASEFDLPLPAARGAASIYVDRGRVEPAGRLLHHDDPPESFACFHNDGAVVLDWPAARFRVDGERVVVDAADEAAAVTLLLHPVWSVVLAARGREALHGCVVERDRRAVAISGPSGFGKTTAGLALLDRGWRLVTDDLIVFDDGGAVVPGPPFVRLPPDRAGGRPGGLDPGGKIRFAPPTAPSPTPLAAMVVMIERADPGLRRLAGIEAVDALLTQVYNPILTHPGQTKRRLDLALDVVRRTPIYAAPPRSLTGDGLAHLVEEAMA